MDTSACSSTLCPPSREKATLSRMMRPFWPCMVLFTYSFCRHSSMREARIGVLSNGMREAMMALACVAATNNKSSTHLECR